MTEEYSAEVKNLQTAMVKKLSGDLAPIGTLQTAWDHLLFSLSDDNPLSKAEIQGISTMQQLFEALMNKKFIDYGNYGGFEERLRRIHPKMASTVLSFQANIIAQIKKDSENSRKNLPIGDEENDGNADDGDDKDNSGKRR